MYDILKIFLLLRPVQPFKPMDFNVFPSFKTIYETMQCISVLKSRTVQQLNIFLFSKPLQLFKSKENQKLWKHFPFKRPFIKWCNVLTQKKNTPTTFHIYGISLRAIYGGYVCIHAPHISTSIKHATRHTVHMLHKLHCMFLANITDKHRCHIANSGWAAAVLYVHVDATLVHKCNKTSHKMQR